MSSDKPDTVEEKPRGVFLYDRDLLDRMVAVEGKEYRPYCATVGTRELAYFGQHPHEKGVPYRTLAMALLKKTTIIEGLHGTSRYYVREDSLEVQFSNHHGDAEKAAKAGFTIFR